MRVRLKLRTCAGTLLVLAAFVGTAARSDETAQDRPVDIQLDAQLARPLGGGWETLELADAWRDATPAEREKYVEWFRSTLRERHAAALGTYTERRAARRRASMDSLVAIFNLLYFAVPAVLLLPLVYWKRFRGRRLRLTGHCLTAASVFTVAVMIFTFAVGLLKEFSLELTAQMDPQLATMNATFQLLHEQAHAIILRDDLPVGLSLRQLEAGADAPFSLLLLYNLAHVHERVFGPAADLYAYWQMLVEYLPHVLSLVMAVLFGWGVRDTLRHTWTMPLRAASGEPRAARAAIRRVVVSGGKEVLAVLSLLVVLIVLNPLASLAIQGLVWPCVEGLFAFCGATLGVLNTDPEPPVRWLVFAVSSVPVFLFAGAITITVASILFLVRALDVMRQRWHAGLALRRQGNFWKRGTWALLRAQWILVMFAAAVLPWISSALPSLEGGNEHDALPRIVTSTLVLWGGALAVFWVLRGPHALWDLSRERLTQNIVPAAPAVEVTPEGAGQPASETSAA